MTTYAASASSTLKDTPGAMREVLASASVQPGIAPSFGLVFHSPDHSAGKVAVMAREALPQTAVLSCSTAGEISERGLTHGGIAALWVTTDEMHVQPSIAGGLSSDATGAGEALCARIPEGSPGWGEQTAVVLVDGLCGEGERLVDELRRRMGGLAEIVGGAAGDEGRFSGTYVAATGESRTDAAAALHVRSGKRWGIGVDHGLTPTGERLRVTKAERNTIFELNGEPAFEVYKRFARNRGVELTPDNAPTFLINHELGVFVFDKLRKARAPLAVGPQGSLRCAAEVPQGSSVAFLTGDTHNLTAAARSAAEEAKERLRGEPAAGVLLFDCICRGTIMGNDFPREIDAVRSVFPKTPIAGFLTYGEIARYSGRLDGWHNTTAVVVAIPA